LKIVGVELQTNKILDFETLDTDEDGEYTKMFEIYGIDKQSKKSNIMRVYITVNDVNEVPVNFVDYTIHVDENEAKISACLASDDTKCLPSEVIADTSATPLDLDRDQALKYYFDDTSDHTDVFSIEEDSGLIKTINALDFETTAEYTLKITAKDNGKPQQEKTVDVTVKINDINESPTVKESMDKEFKLAEDKTAGFEIFTTDAEDLDGDDTTIKYEIQAGNEEDIFEIAESTGVVTVKVNSLDFEDVNEYELTIRTTDTRDAKEMELYTDETIKIKLEDINEPPSINYDTDDEGLSLESISRSVGEGLGEYTKVDKKINLH
jgi:glutamate synthase domain-containing protein 2